MMQNSKIDNVQPEQQPNDAVKADELPSAQVAQNPMLAAGFSPNLQKFLKKNPHFTQIHLDPVDKVWYIGYMDSNNIWCGAKFLDVLCRGRQALKFSYAKSVYMRFIERSEQFWNCSAYMGRRMFRRWYW